MRPRAGRIRSAFIWLWAVPGRVFRLIFCESLTLWGVGLLIGAPRVLAASGPMSRVVLGANVGDPLILAGAALVVSITAAAAATCRRGVLRGWIRW